MEKRNDWKLLPSCGKEAEGLDIILACDGAASVGQVGNEVAVKLTKKILSEISKLPGRNK